jgi:DNA repair protein RadC
VGQLIGISVLDHIIIGSGSPGYISFRDAGLL